MLNAYRDMPININLNVMRIIATAGEEFSVLLNATPYAPFSIDARTKFTTNMESPSSFAATYGKA